MIAFDFDYYKPESVEEAFVCMSTLKASGKKAFYYSGGTELVTLFRKGKIVADAVIDLKGISEMCRISNKEHETVIGACTTLNEIIENTALPILNEVCDKVADHTVRNALTLGGNLCGRLPFKEVVLPLLALQADILIYGANGFVRLPLSTVFNKRLSLKEDEIVCQVILPSKWPSFCYSKRITASTDVDYPIVHLVLTADNDEVFVGLSGFSSAPVYARWNQTFDLNLTLAWAQPLSKGDERASAAYRNHLLSAILEEVLEVYPNART